MLNFTIYVLAMIRVHYSIMFIRFFGNLTHEKRAECCLLLKIAVSYFLLNFSRFFHVHTTAVVPDVPRGSRLFP